MLKLHTVLLQIFLKFFKNIESGLVFLLQILNHLCFLRAGTKKQKIDSIDKSNTCYYKRKFIPNSSLPKMVLTKSYKNFKQLSLVAKFLFLKIKLYKNTYNLKITIFHVFI